MHNMWKTLQDVEHESRTHGFTYQRKDLRVHFMRQKTPIPDQLPKSHEASHRREEIHMRALPKKVLHTLPSQIASVENPQKSHDR